MTKQEPINRGMNEQLSRLVAAYGWRVSNLDAKRLGIPERVLFDACVKGQAKLVYVHELVTAYLIFA